MRRVHVQTVSFANTAITLALGIACAILFWQGRAQFEVLQQANEAYISCESDAQQMQDRSDYLTEQVRLVTMTAKPEYIDSYFSIGTATRSSTRRLRISKAGLREPTHTNRYAPRWTNQTS